MEPELRIKKYPSKPFSDQKLGTSGLRKKVKVFQQENYLENLIQAYFNALRRDALSPNNSLLVAGDGRYFSVEAIHTILRIACANGVDEVHVAKDSLMSTPACSAYIRELNAKQGNCLGGILLTASHNPGGPSEDFGVKFNGRNGGPAQEEFTNAVFEATKKITQYQAAEAPFDIPIGTVSEHVYRNVLRPCKRKFTIKVVENVHGYVEMLRREFDFSLITALLARPDFTCVFDGMNGVAGPYAKAVFGELSGNSASSKAGDKVLLRNCDPLPDFGGIHPDPNLKCAAELVELCGARPESPPTGDRSKYYKFGAACDGDADRNMILGHCCFVTPSDSLAVLAANSGAVFKKGLQGVARSMPTSGAVDKVAKKLGLELYETPTGWKYFGNLMDEELITLCGEESFGTGSSHIREKDGLWTILAWLQLLAKLNAPEQPFKGIPEVLADFWKEFGRNFYCRYDYENCQTEAANKVWEALGAQVKLYSTAPGEQKVPGLKADVFEYTDPVDGSFAGNQGYRFIYPDGSRVVFRLSGTGSVGATIRVYFEKYRQEQLEDNPLSALKEIIDFGLEISQVRELTGKPVPDVIT